VLTIIRKYVIAAPLFTAATASVNAVVTAAEGGPVAMAAALKSAQGGAVVAEKAPDDSQEVCIGTFRRFEYILRMMDSIISLRVSNEVKL
jgi:hypothetical protein